RIAHHARAGAGVSRRPRRVGWHRGARVLLRCGVAGSAGLLRLRLLPHFVVAAGPLARFLEWRLAGRRADCAAPVAGGTDSGLRPLWRADSTAGPLATGAVGSEGWGYRAGRG